MFRFFFDRKWFLWAWLGSLLILTSLWVQVKIDVEINNWFGEFYDMIQKALATPNAITIEEYWASLFSFIYLAGIYVAIAVVSELFHCPLPVPLESLHGRVVSRGLRSGEDDRGCGSAGPGGYD